MPRGALRYVDLRDLGYEAPDRVHEHIASPWGVLARILPKRRVTPSDVFIDIGCGMGPVLVEAAARYDFRRAIGIDVVPEFTEVAEQTIARGRDHLRCRDIEVLTGDVTEYGLPDDVTVVFMADPFRGPIFDAVIAKIIASVDRSPRLIRLIYSNPVEGGRLESTGRIRLVRLGRRKGRPWTTAPDLAMYEIAPSTDGARAGERQARPLPRRLRRPATGTPDRAASRPLPERATIQARSDASGTRVVLAGESGDLESLRAAFDRDHCIRLPDFLSGPLLDRISGYLEEGDKASALLFLLLNDADVFKLVRAITGCRRIGRFEGGLHRTLPGLEHAEAWHGDIFGHGMVSMTIDVSSRPYEGGVLETRDRHSEEVLHRSETSPGDATLVRVAPFLQQRVTAVEGDTPRTVYSGRFMLSRSGADSKLVGLGSPPASTG
jgi:precorrin-6B methylase 2